MPVTKAEHEIVWTWAGKTIQVGLERLGAGPILLLLPALSSISTRSEMRPLQQRLASTFTTVSVDWPGFGDQPKPCVDWRPEAYSAFLDHLVTRVIPKSLCYRRRRARGGLRACPGRHCAGSMGRLCLVAPTWRGPLPTMMGKRNAAFARIVTRRRSPVTRTASLQAQRQPLRRTHDGARARLRRSELAQRIASCREACGDENSGGSTCLSSLCRRRARPRAKPRRVTGAGGAHRRSNPGALRGWNTAEVEGRDGGSCRAAEHPRYNAFLGQALGARGVS